MSTQSRKRRSWRHLRIELLRERIPFHGGEIGVTEPLPWFDPNELTYSLAPDGTEVAGFTNTLSEQLSKLGNEQQWQSTIDDALNAWVAPLGASVTRVTDSGAPFGTFGPTQADTRFGDVRIAAIPMSETVLATSLPHSAVIQGSWAGDILINSNVDWKNLGEIHSVILHEFGHVLGLDHSTNPYSAMFAHGVGVITSPSPDDQAALQSLYAGVVFDNDDGESDGSDEKSDDASVALGESSDDDAVANEAAAGGWQFNVDLAVPIAPVVGSTVRYVADGTIDPQGNAIFQLDLPTNEFEALESLTVSVMTFGKASPFSDLRIIDSAGREVESVELHHGQGVIVKQVQGIESGETYFAVINNVFPVASGDPPITFSLVGELRPELELGKKLDEVDLDEERSYWSQSITVASTRFVHLHVDARETSDIGQSQTVVVTDADNNVVTRVSLKSGTQRSAPLALLEPGLYTIHYTLNEPGDSSGHTKLVVYLDEVSFDVGPVPIDPSGQPYLQCDDPDANPDYCYVYQPISPEPPSPNPGTGPAVPGEEWWYYYYGYTCVDYAPTDFVFVQDWDPEWWIFYTQVCNAITPPNPDPPNPDPPNPDPPNPDPPNPDPPNPDPPNPTPNPDPPNPTPTDPTPGISVWQNPVSQFDVSNDSVVSPVDALMVINLIARSGGAVSVTSTALTSFPDVNGDFQVTPMDALAVINKLSRLAIAAGEGEMAAPVPISLASGSWPAAVDSALSGEQLLEPALLF